MDIQFGISLLSFFPWSWRPLPLLPWSAVKAAGWMEEVGYEFLQGIPLRGISGYKEWPLPMRYKERVWIETRNVWDGLRRAVNEHGLRTGPDNWILFSNPPGCERVFERLPGEAIANRWWEPGCSHLELTPTFGKGVEEIKTVLEASRWGLVLDTEHAVEERPHWDPHRDEPNLLGADVEERLDSVKRLARFVSLLHVKGFGENDRRVIETFLDSSDRPDRFDILAEYRPIVPATPAQTIRHAALFLRELRQIFA